MPRPRDLIGIGDFARRVRLTPKQLRDYDENGLLAPAYVDADSGYRYYHRGQARTAVTIALLRSLDVPLSAVHELLVSDDVAALLAVQRARIEAEVERGRATLRSLDRLLTREDLMPYTVLERDEPALTLHGLHARCAAEELERDVPRTIAELAAHLGPERFDAEPVTGLYPLDLDGEVAYFVGVAAPADTPDAVSLPAARVAATTHGGRPSELQLAYFPLIAHVQERGLQPGPQVQEIYRPNLTEVLLPIGGPS
jgi:DNA-binding transcriptional MerR regulator